MSEAYSKLTDIKQVVYYLNLYSITIELDIVNNTQNLLIDPVENNAFYDVNETWVKGLGSIHDSNV